MKKIKLDLDDLKVESFDTQPQDASDGEVFGYQCPTYPGCPTCDATCPSTCPNTCPNTCFNTCSGVGCGETFPIRSCFPTEIGPTCPV